MKLLKKAILSVFFVYFISNSQAVEITVWEDDVVAPSFYDAIEDFYKETGIKVKVETGNYVFNIERLRLDGPAGVGPDLVLMPNDQIGQAVKEGLIVPIDFDDNEEIRYLPLAKEAALYRDVYYFIPRSIETLAIFYNKDLLDEPFKTMDEWIQYNLDLQKKKRFGFVAKFDDLYFLHGALEPYGASIFKTDEYNTYDTSEVHLNSQETIDAVRSIKRFYDLELIPTATMGSGSVNNILDLFLKKRTSAVLAGSWNISTVLKRKLNLGITPLPLLENGMHMSSFVGVRGYAISQMTKHYDEALKFAKFINKDKYQIKRFKETNQLPATLSALKDKRVYQDKFAKPFLEQIRFGYLMPKVPEMSIVWAVYAERLYSIFSGRESVEAGLYSAAREYKYIKDKQSKAKY